MVEIPRKLRATPIRETPGTYLVRIGENPIGNVVQTRGKDAKPVFEFTSTWEGLPINFKTKTMKEIREELTRRISRDKYMEILEAKKAE